MKKPVLLIGMILFFASVFPIVGTSSINENITSQEPQEVGKAWLEGWLYRKIHNITGFPTGSQVNYPVSLNAHFSYGMDFFVDVYFQEKCRPDFGDVRFYDHDDNPLNYWIQEKDDGVNAVFWIKLNTIPQYPENATILVYYGNPNASTTSSKDLTFEFATGFEDGTNQGWTISWSTHLLSDGVSVQAFQGEYSRIAGRRYGSSWAGIGNFYEHFQNSKYFSPGTYRMEGAAKFSIETSLVVPQGVQFSVNDVTVCNKSDPGTSWRWLGGNFSIGYSGYFQLDIEFHLKALSGLASGSEEYRIDLILIRRWCDPEPTHGGWGGEETPVDDDTPPQIHSVDWRSTVPYPFVESSIPRHTEPVVVTANVSDEDEGSGVAFVHVSYRISSSQWWWTTMTYNTTEELWTATIPGQPGNSSLEFFIGTSDLAGNVQESSLFSYEVQHLIVGDLNGDGIVDIFDIVRAAGHYGESW